MPTAPMSCGQPKSSGKTMLRSCAPKRSIRHHPTQDSRPRPCPPERDRPKRHPIPAEAAYASLARTPGRHQGQRSCADRAIWHPPGRPATGPAARFHRDRQRCLHANAWPGPTDVTNALLSSRTSASLSKEQVTAPLDRHQPCPGTRNANRRRQPHRVTRIMVTPSAGSPSRRGRVSVPFCSRRRADRPVRPAQYCALGGNGGCGSGIAAGAEGCGRSMGSRTPERCSRTTASSRWENLTCP